MIEFTQTSLVHFCQQLCSRADRLLSPFVTSSSSPSSSSRQHQSALYVIIRRCDQLIQLRTLSSRLCLNECPLLLHHEKDNMAKNILEEMKKILKQQITSEEIRRLNPLLWERMRCYRRIPILRGQVDRSGGVIDNVQRGFHHRHHGGRGGKEHKVSDVSLAEQEKRQKKYRRKKAREERRKTTGNPHCQRRQNNKRKRGAGGEEKGGAE
jgi:hypothetical protein